jgi:hypothetical protein
MPPLMVRARASVAATRRAAVDTRKERRESRERLEPSIIIDFRFIIVPALRQINDYWPVNYSFCRTWLDCMTMPRAIYLRDPQAFSSSVRRVHHASSAAARCMFVDMSHVTGNRHVEWIGGPFWMKGNVQTMGGWIASQRERDSFEETIARLRWDGRSAR